MTGTVWFDGRHSRHVPGGRPLRLRPRRGPAAPPGNIFMADIRAFRGIRYDMAQVGALSDVVAPPYDVIDAALQDRLYDASPYNIIRLELNREEPGDDAEQNRYTRAAQVPEGLATARGPARRPAPRALRLPSELRGRGHPLHPQGLPGPRPPGSRSAAGRSTRTSRRSRARRPTGSRSSRRRGST